MAGNLRRIKDIFVVAVDLDDPKEREAYLDRECQSDPELRARVEQLLQAHEQPISGLNKPLGEVNAAASENTQTFTPNVGHDLPRTESVSPPIGIIGQEIAGRYKLLEAIGEGGMGTVWMAQQTTPVKRTVAIKLIKGGMDSKAILARFEAERQALAMMDHPNIAKVLEAGATSDGKPFFVMELVKGIPITKYCDEMKLTPKERLELFVPVCQAIQHAHQKGIIHRDIKPSNVLIALYDGRPVPKVIDFGVAKAAGQPLTDKTLHTGFGAVVGTPEYMSPEQASFNQLDVDTRSDVYALGVLLYELLTGSPPFKRKELETAGLLEILRVIREEEPPRPSTKLSTAQGLPNLAANRGTEPKRLTGLLRGELDWIVMKALEKDRNRRYETANGLAMDVQRYLSGEAVQAVPPSTGYRLKKFLRKNKGPVIAASLIFLALLAGIAGTTFGLVHAKQQRRLAEEKHHEAEEERSKAANLAQTEREQRKLAEEARKRADEEAAIAKAVNDFLQNDLLWQSDARRQVVDRNQPNRNINITVRELLDRAAKTVGEKFKDRPLVEAAIRFTIADTYLGIGLDDLASPHAQRAVNLREAFLGPKHLDTLAAKCTLAFMVSGSQAEMLLREVLTVYEVELPKDDPETLRAKFALAVAYQRQRKYEQAEPLYRETTEKYKSLFGLQNPAFIAPLNALAGLYAEQGRNQQAEELLKEILDSPPAKDWANLSDARLAKYQLAKLYDSQGKYDLAEQLQKELVIAHIRAFGIDHKITLSTKTDLVEVYRNQKKHALAEPILIELADIWKRKQGPESLEYAYQLALLGSCRLQQKKWSEAEPILRECLVIREQMQPDSWLKFNTKSLLGEALLGQKKYAEAEPLLLIGYEGMKQREAEIPSKAKIRLQEAVERLIQLYEATEKKKETATWRQELEVAKRYIQNDVEIGRLFSLIQVGKVAEAIEKCPELMKKFSWNNTQWYDFACIYSVASSRISDKKQEYADRSMELLQKAIQAGFNRPATMEIDIDLDPLRDREDFKQLLRGLSKTPLQPTEIKE